MRAPVRLLALALLALPAPAAAQRGRVSLVPYVGRAMTSPIFEHSVREVVNYPVPDGEGQQVTRTAWRRLALSDATVVGGRIELGLGGRWTAFADGAYGRTEFEEEYLLAELGSGPAPIAHVAASRLSDRASITQLALGVGRRVPLWHRSFELGLGVAASVQRFTLVPHVVQCDGLDPSPCVPEGFEEGYWLPGGAGSLSLRWALGPRAGLEVRSTFVAGRANTERYDYPSAAFDGSQSPPDHEWVRGAQLAVGLSVRP